MVDNKYELIKTTKGWKTLCPFHKDTNPSFVLTEFDGVERFYCFGCNVKGDIVKFVQDEMMLDRDGAIEHLCKKYDIDVSSVVRDLTDEERELERKYSIMHRVALYCWENLVGVEGFAYNYIKHTRGIDSDETIEKFLIGYCDSVTNLMEALRIDNVGPIGDMELDRSYLWNNALVFPVFSTEGKINKFYTRPFNPTNEDLKYISTSNKHPLFTNQDALFGLYQTRMSDRRRSDGVIAVEGFFDCLVMHDKGYDNTVAICGTRITQDNIDLLNKYNIKKLKVIFDGDQAGHQAALRLVNDELRLKSIDLRVNITPDDKDPADYLANQRGSLFANVIEDASPPQIYYIDNMINKYYILDDVSGMPYIDAEKSILFIRDVAHFINNNKVETKLLIRRVAELTHLNEIDVSDYVKLYSDDDQLSNIQAECSIIKQLLEDTIGVVTSEICSQISDEDMSIDRNRYLFLKITKRIAEDKHVSYEWIKNSALIDGRDSLIEYIDSHILHSKILDYRWCMEEILDKARRRVAVDVAKNTITKASDLRQPIASVIEEFSGRVAALSYGSDSRATTRQDLFNNAVDVYNHRKNLETTILGFPFGSRWEMANDLIGGLERGKAILMSAATGVGKTNVALNWAVDFSMATLEGFNSAKVLYMPVEMAPEALQFRMWAIHSGVGARKIEKGMKLTKEEQYQLSMTMEICREYGPIIKRPRTNTLSAIMYEINYWKAKEDIDIVVVDYIQRLSPCEMTGNRQDWDRYDYSAMLLCDRAQIRGDIAMVVLSQLSDDAKKAGIDVEGGSSRSKSIPNHFDYHVVMIRKNLKQIEQHGAQNGNRFIKFDKNRFGMDQCVIHAHLFNHQIFNDQNPTDAKFGNLRVGEIESMKKLLLPDGRRMIEDIQISANIAGHVI
jgi:DNA primase catalytic core